MKTAVYPILMLALVACSNLPRPQNVSEGILFANASLESAYTLVADLRDAGTISQSAAIEHRDRLDVARALVDDATALYRADRENEAGSMLERALVITRAVTQVLEGRQ